MSEGHTGPDDNEDQTVPEETNAQTTTAEQPAAEAPVAEAGEQVIAEKPTPKKRAPRKPKAPSETVASEQSEMAIEKPAAAKPAARKAAAKPAEPPPPVEEEKRSALREPVVMWSIIGGAIVILAALGYVGWTQFGPHQAGGTAASALANRSVCEATLDRAQAYGVLSPNATLAQADPDKTQVDGRVTCHAQADGAQYAVTVDVPCDDMSKDTCVKLYSVKQADGTALFQRQM